MKLSVRETAQLKYGDYQLESSPLITKLLSEVGVKVGPADVAKRIATAFPPSELVDRVDVSNVHVNVYLNPIHVGKRVAAVFSKVNKSYNPPYYVFRESRCQRSKRRRLSSISLPRISPSRCTSDICALLSLENRFRVYSSMWDLRCCV